jgi:hypothetical protein
MSYNVAPGGYLPQGGFAPSQGQPGIPPGGTTARPLSAPPSSQGLVQQPAPRPSIRAQSPDETPPPPSRPLTPVTLPSPEQLGVAVAPPPAADSGLDMSAVDHRLQALGAVCFQMNKLAGERWRVTCLLPTNQTDCTHRVEAEAATKAEAVRVVVEQAEKWAGVRK